MVKIIKKIRDHFYFTGKHTGAAHSIWNLKFNLPNEIPVVFQNGSNYGYYFIIKEFAKESERQFECLDKNTEKYKTFSVLIKREVIKVNEDSIESVATISDKIKLIDSARFMAKSLSNLVDNLTERI